MNVPCELEKSVYFVVVVVLRWKVDSLPLDHQGSPSPLLLKDNFVGYSNLDWWCFSLNI